MGPLDDILGDALAHEGEREFAAPDVTVEADDVEAVAGLHRRRGHLVRREAEQSLLELGCSVAPGELAKVTAGSSRRTIGVRGRQVGKAAGLAREHCEDYLGTVARSGEGFGLVAAGGDEDVGGLVEVGGTEAAAVVVVVAPAGILIRFRHSDLVRDQAADQRLLIGLAAPVTVGLRLGLQVLPARLLQQELAYGERTGGLLPGAYRGGLGMMLHLAGDGVVRDDYTVDADCGALHFSQHRLEGAGHRRHSAGSADRRTGSGRATGRLERTTW